MWWELQANTSKELQIGEGWIREILNMAESNLRRPVEVQQTNSFTSSTQK